MKKTMLTLCLAILFCCGVANAQKMIKAGGPPPVFEGSGLKIDGGAKLGGSYTLSGEIKMLRDVENVKIHFTLKGGVKILSGEKYIYYKKLAKGQIINPSITVTFESVPASVQRSIWGKSATPGGSGVYYDVVDDEGTLMSLPQYVARNNERNFKKIEYRYDPEEPLPLNEQNIQPGMINGEKAKATRDAIENLKKTKGEVSDIEAIELLHNRIELFIRSGVEGQKAIDILWDAREKTKSKGGDYWKNVEEILKARKIKFFRPNGYNNSYGVDDSFSGLEKISTPKATVTLTGQFLYKKHCSDTANGLLATTIDMPVRRAKIWVWGYWSGQGLTRFGPTMTDENGNFTVNVDNVVYPARFCPFVYCKGPDYAGTKFERIKVVTDTIKFNYSDGPDSLTWRFRWWKWDTVSTSSYTFSRSPSYAGEQAFDGGLYPTANQPRSGAVNIFDVFLNAYDTLVTNDHTDDATLYRIAAKWQPGYSLTDHGFGGTCTDMYPSGYVDTTWVNADTTGEDKTTDEWDDMVLLHEFAHHAMAKCAEFPPNATGSHKWFESHPEKPNMSYSEGWANFFNHVVSDSLFYIDTKEMIGKADTTVGWWNIENPWSHYDSINNPLQAGPYCEAAVAGSLWDLYDSQDENPYPNDSAYADTLTMGFGPIWDVTTKYTPGGRNCYNIWEFIQGWGNFYDRFSGFESILRHHKIFKPARPINVTAGVSPFDYWTVVVTWEKGGSKYSGGAKDDTISVGYNIYRRAEGEKFYSKINDTLITAFTFDDPNRLDNKNYFYMVAGVDTSKVEGFFSDSVKVYVPHPPFKTRLSNATAFNNTHKLLYSPASGKAHLIYGSDNGLYYSYSTDFGLDWSTDTVLSYEADNRSCLALDTLGRPSVIWKKWSSTFEYTRQSSPWIPPIWLPAIVYSRPTMAISRHDTAYVAYTYYSVVSNEETCEGKISLVTFPITDFMSAINENLDLPGKTPMVAVDDSDNVYIAYASGNDIYFADRTNGIWGTPINISQSPAISQHPMIDVYGDKLSVTWEEDNGGSFDIYNKILTISANTWTNSENVSNNISNSLNPTTAMSGYVYWSDNENGYYRIYSKRFIDGAGWPDSAKRTITDNDSICNYPQITFSQTIDTTKILAIWTQGNASPYDVKFQRNIVQPVSKIYIDGGQELASPFNIRRDGFKVFGPASYQSIDYGAEEVAYKFDNLNSTKDYKVSVTYYFENVENNAKGQSNKPIWHEQLKVDKQTVATSKVKAGQPTTVEVLVPPQWYAKDGSIVLTVKNINGKYAMATDVKLYEFSKPTSTEKTDGGTQTAFTTPVTLPLTNQLCQNAPNPFGSQPTTIQYAVTKPGNVSLKVYNISGQVVKTLVNESKQPGFYNARWNGKDETGRQAAAGVYFYRIQANGFDNTKKLVVLK
ncbi:T9SS type A sorting domain-containing protein [candidate division TA06 bacterium]|uniref:T9SS type A sorting domain-containing protein n=1 Tax=candidate division TA06 bacterium TaxID=2250710 RepID=A0A933ICM1_UNCT6|nr:T9SS type A sorting domain-containing protein [candidate division TA06 bacterium]